MMSAKIDHQQALEESQRYLLQVLFVAGDGMKKCGTICISLHTVAAVK